MTDKPPVGHIQIFSELSVYSGSGGIWVPFDFDAALEHVSKLRRFPKARIFNGAEYITCPLKGHIMKIFCLFEETENDR